MEQAICFREDLEAVETLSIEIVPTLCVEMQHRTFCVPNPQRNLKTRRSLDALFNF